MHAGFSGGRWSVIPILEKFSTVCCNYAIVKGVSIVSEAGIDFFFFWNSLAFSNDPMDVGNLISGSSAFSMSV